MSVYYDKSRKGWYIRVAVGEKLFSCYHAPNQKGFFKKKADAKDYESIFIASLQGEDTKDTVIVNEYYIINFKKYLKTKLKPSTYYGYINTFEKYWLKKVMGLDVTHFNNTGLEAIVERVFAGRTNWNGKAAVGKWFVKFMRKVNPNLDPMLVVAPKIFTPKTHEYNVYTEEEFRQFLSVIEDDQGGSFSCSYSITVFVSQNALAFAGATSNMTVSISSVAPASRTMPIR